MIRRRPTQVFSLAFLDCICCGFGAVILIFVLTVASQDQANQATLASLHRVIAGQMAALAKIRASQEELDRTRARALSLVAGARAKDESLRSMLDDFERQIQNQKKGQQALLVDIDDLKKEIAARQKKPDMVLPDVKPLPVGLPVGSNYLAFVIDTSGSMRNFDTGELWPIVISKVEEVLEVYPHVEGVQVLDTDGRFIMGERGGAQWLTDSPEMRDALRRALRHYDVFSESTPVQGIFRALRTLYDPKNPDMKMGIYVFGDEFTGTADAVLKRLDELNPADAEGKRKVVINAVIFPTTIRFDFSLGNTGVKMANLMREICHQHGGAMIALQDL